MTPLRATTRLVGLLGWPVDHSLSPLMQGAAFEAAGLDWAYVALPVAPIAQRVGEAVRGLRALHFAGANVTVPHKQAVIPYLDALDPAARLIGAVNTIHISASEEMTGYNTDSDGAFEAIERGAGFRVEGRRVALLGAGGAARAIAFGALLRGAAEIRVLNRQAEIEPARELAAALGQAGKNRVKTSAVAFEDVPAARQALEDAELVAHATPLGMKDGDPMAVPVDWIARGATVFDAVYTPRRERTPFLEACERDRGCATVPGLGMLLFQGVRAFRVWTGRDPDIAVMEAALRSALRERA